MINKQIIGSKLKEARQQKGITQNEIANELGIKQQAYSRFETGIFEMDYETLIYLCQRFDISSDYLLGLTNEHGTKVQISNSFNNNKGKIDFKG